MIKDLTKGSIVKNLLNVSLPVMGASLFQMAYQIIDMFWLGKLSSGSVAAVGTAGFYVGLSYSISTLVYIGAGIKVSQSVGESNKKRAIEYSLAALLLIFLISICITALILFFRKDLIGFFNIKSKEIYLDSISYLTIVMLFSIFKNTNLTFNSIFIGFGNGKAPLVIGSVALILNIILDPILIFGYKNIPPLGVKGAAYATVTSQIIAALAYLIFFFNNIKHHITGQIKIKVSSMLEILKLSYPVAIQRVIFTSVSIALGKIISSWGTNAIAIQKIGVQLESLSWVTAGGMRAAISSFIGQNYGAKKILRLKRGYITSVLIISSVGLLVSIIFTLFPREIFSLFVKEEDVILGGVTYLRILATSQVFMCIDITTMGAFAGIGKTGIPPISSITFTALRVPLALLLSLTFGLGLSGVWLSISITSVIKGTLLMCLFFYFVKILSIRKKQ